MPWPAILILVTSCGFAARQTGLSDEDDDPDEVPRVVCDAGDATLRLCVDFEAQLVSTIPDLSAWSANAIASGVGAMEHDWEQAAALTADSTVHVGEVEKLDIRERISIDLWIRPTAMPADKKRFYILDNEKQYSVAFTDKRAVRCTVKDRDVDSKPLPIDDRWHHVGCAYDGSTLQVFVDGQLDACRLETIAIPTDGNAGLALGANLAGSSARPTFTDQFVGGLDNVRVWARTGVDLCAAAGANDCRTSCL